MVVDTWGQQCLCHEPRVRTQSRKNKPTGVLTTLLTVDWPQGLASGRPSGSRRGPMEEGRGAVSEVAVEGRPVGSS